MRQKKMKEHTVLELCAGAGGSALGLEMAGFRHEALVEIDPHACATLRMNRPYWNVIEADISRFDASYWRGVDLVSGGLPCPPFSVAGKQLGSNDERDMFPSLLRIVQQVKPRAVLIENVRGLMTNKFSEYRLKLNRSFDSLGYDVSWNCFNAVDFGVPQFRYRSFLIGLKRNQTLQIEWPNPILHTPNTVSGAIGDLMESRDWRGAGVWKKKAVSPAPTIVGGSRKHGGPDLGPTRARAEWARLGVDGKGVADEAPDRYFEGMPKLTTRMVARLQSFPDDWHFSGGKTQTYRQIGNALPAKLACATAEAVRRCLE
jgi:DNA (cytosine-5)-methyltransferase 1